ncbi:hypothetical protein FZC66_05775 [Priestia megaterium]|nr:hypothetical protein FZC66_05775 [Priestia megaterium]
MNSEDEYKDFSNVEKQRNFLTAEEFPEGPYGSTRGKDKRVENKSTPWEENQQYYTSTTYEFRNLHQDLPRQFPGSHLTHDEKDKNEEDQ